MRDKMGRTDEDFFEPEHVDFMVVLQSLRIFVALFSNCEVDKNFVLILTADLE